MEKFSSRPTFVKAKTPNNGSPTPVNKNPIPAKSQSFPMAIPKEGGKIRLPAPKNMANKANPKTTASFFLFIKIPLLQDLCSCLTIGGFLIIRLFFASFMHNYHMLSAHKNLIQDNNRCQ